VQPVLHGGPLGPEERGVVRIVVDVAIADRVEVSFEQRGRELSVFEYAIEDELACVGNRRDRLRRNLELVLVAREQLVLPSRVDAALAGELSVVVRDAM